MPHISSLSNVLPSHSTDLHELVSDIEHGADEGEGAHPQPHIHGMQGHSGQEAPPHAHAVGREDARGTLYRRRRGGEGKGEGGRTLIEDLLRSSHSHSNGIDNVCWRSGWTHLWYN